MPSIDTSVASDVFQVREADCPCWIVVGSAVKLAVGAGGGGGGGGGAGATFFLQAALIKRTLAKAAS